MNGIQTAPKQKLRIFIGIPAILAALSFLTVIFASFMRSVSVLIDRGFEDYIESYSFSQNFYESFPVWFLAIGSLLLALYMLFFTKKQRFEFMAPTALFLISVLFLITFYDDFAYTVMVLFGVYGGGIVQIVTDTLSCILTLLLAVLFTASGVCIIGKKLQRAALITAAIVGFLLTLFVFVSTADSILVYLNDLFDGINAFNSFLWVVSFLSRSSGYFMLSVTMLIFGIQGGIPKVQTESANS